MQRIRKKLTYANVMSSIAVFLVLGGASALAASHLHRNSVGTKQLKRNAVTTAKLKRNAVSSTKIRTGSITATKIKNASVTEAKIKDGSVSTTKIKAGAIGAAQLNTNSVGNSQTQLVKVFKGGAVPAASSEGSAPRVSLGQVGPFKFYAQCFLNGESVEQKTFIELTGGSATVSGRVAKLLLDEYVTPSSPPVQRTLLEATAKPDTVDARANSEFSASASDGTQITGTIAGAAKAGNPPGGNGPFLSGNSCLVGSVAIFGS